MKRYLSFMGDNYYPSAAMGDFVGDFDNVNDAINSLTSLSSEFFDSEKGMRVTKSYSDKETWNFLEMWCVVYDCEIKDYVWSNGDL